jgi:hypothetical protein
MRSRTVLFCLLLLAVMASHAGAAVAGAAAPADLPPADAEFLPIAMAYRQQALDSLALPLLTCTGSTAAGIDAPGVPCCPPLRDEPTPLALLSGDPVYVLMSLQR